MSDIETQYQIPNRAKSLTVVASAPINENWENIEQALNINYELASQVSNKIDSSEKGVEGGVATLDINNTLELSQLPEQAKGHVYEVNSLNEQLNVNAFTGDICVRLDLGKTYTLKNNDPTMFSNWVEIASTNSGGDIGGNPPYTNLITEEKWEYENNTNKYYVTISNSEHKQGSTKFLFASTKNEIGQEVYCEYVVDEQGTVIIYTDVAFNCSLIISNLEGNTDNIQYIPYCINVGSYNEDVPNIFSYSLDSISLITSPEITLIDGLNLIQKINQCNDTYLTEISDGEYTVFIDSDNINDNVLSELTIIPSEDYLGIVKILPNKATNNQRCYLMYDKSYLYSNGGWVSKAFTPVGNIVIKNKEIINTYTYPYRQNGVNINIESHGLDRLYGPQIIGGTVTIDEKLTISNGTCLIDNIVMEFGTFNKDYNSKWDKGSGQGCLDLINNDVDIISYSVSFNDTTYYVEEPGTINEYVSSGIEVYQDKELKILYKNSEDNEFLYTGEVNNIQIPRDGWGYIFIIANDYEYDFMMSFNSYPTLPMGFKKYRRIGYFYRKNNKITEMSQYENITYLNEPIKICNEETIEQIIPTINAPSCEEFVLRYKKSDSDTVISFKTNNITLYESSSKVQTITLPNTELDIQFENPSSLELAFIGYVDRRIDA